MGIIELLDEEVKRGQGNDDNFVSKLQAMEDGGGGGGKDLVSFRKGHHRGEFTVHHYAGKVTYQVPNTPTYQHTNITK